MTLLACVATPADTGGVDATDSGEPAETHLGEVATLEGVATWTFDFDETAEAGGYVDCAYTRTYRNGLEERFNPWQCPDCDIFHRLESNLDGYGCRYQVWNDEGDEPDPVVYIGWDDEQYYGASGENGWAYDYDGSTATVTDTSAELWYPQVLYDDHYNSLGSYVMSAALTRGIVLADPMRGLYPPDAYSCGWTRADEPAYEGDFRFDLGDEMGDGVFLDACGDPVRLWDLVADGGVVIVMAADDGPSVELAGTQASFEAALAASGVDLPIVTLLTPSNQGGTLEPSVESVSLWASVHGVSGPVLADRAFGVHGLAENGIMEIEDIGHMDFPWWVVVDGDHRVLAVGQAATSWDDIAEGL